MRELEQTIRAAAAMAASEEIGPNDLGLPGGTASSVSGGDDFEALLELPLTEAKAQLVERFERYAITRALERNDGNISAAARDLGVHRQSLQQKLAALGIQSSRSTGGDEA